MSEQQPKSELAAAIRRIRGSSSQQDFAHTLNIAVVSVSRYEHGAPPELPVLRKFHERAIHQSDWEAERTFRVEIENRVGLDANTLLIGFGHIGRPAGTLMTVADMTTPTEEGLVVGLIRLLRNSKDKNERRALHALLDPWASPILDQAAKLERLPERKKRRHGRSQEENEYRIVSAVIKFLRDRNTSARDLRLLETVLAQQLKD